MRTMPSTTDYKRGDIVLVPFPFTDLTDVRQRPAVVLSADWFNEARPDIVLAAITSQVPAELDRDEVRIAEENLEVTGLPRVSMIRTGKLFTIDKTLIRRSMGVLPDELLGELDDLIREVLAL